MLTEGRLSGTDGLCRTGVCERYNPKTMAPSLGVMDRKARQERERETRSACTEFHQQQEEGYSLCHSRPTAPSCPDVARLFSSEGEHVLYTLSPTVSGHGPAQTHSLPGHTLSIPAYTYTQRLFYPLQPFVTSPIVKGTQYPILVWTGLW